MEKYKMYVSIANQQVYHHPNDSSWEYAVEVPEQYVRVFQRLSTQMEQIEVRNFLRGHMPFFDFAEPSHNTDIDVRTMKVYALIHEFTDDKSKQFIEKLPYFR